MKISEQKQGAVTVVKPEGPLVGKDVEQFQVQGGKAMTEAMGRVVLDMSAVAFVDSKGLEALVDLAEEMGTRGQSLKLCSTGKTLREVFELTDLVKHFEHYEDVNSAVRSFL